MLKNVTKFTKGSLCRCEVRPPYIGSEHTYAWAPTSGRATWVCATQKRSQSTFWSFLLFLKDLLLKVMQKERYQSQIYQNFETVCHTEVCLTFSRFAAKLLEIIAKYRGRNLKIPHQCPLTSMASKTAWPNISKIASNCCIFSKD
jgi:hypothetical protein